MRNKKGARYRYYVSQALLQNRRPEAGKHRSGAVPRRKPRVRRVRRHLAAMGKEPPAGLQTGS